MDEVQDRQVYLDVLVVLLSNLLLPLDEGLLDLGGEELWAQGVDDLHGQVNDHPCGEELTWSPVCYLH